jgi:alanine racemase
MKDFHEHVRILRDGTHALIDLDAYERNIQTLRGLIPTGTAFMAVVKADGYGHGAAMCGHAAIQAGADYLGVARIAEALYLRDQGVTASILVLGPPSTAALVEAISRQITLAVGTSPGRNP